MRTISSTRDVAPGASAPLGATVLPDGVNFSVFSKHAVLLELLLFDDENATQPARIIPLPADQHRTYHYWHAFVTCEFTDLLRIIRQIGQFVQHDVRFEVTNRLDNILTIEDITKNRFGTEVAE